TLIMSFILLAVAFSAGLVIGKTDQNIGKNKSANDNNQLSACSFKLQEITAKHLSLMDIAKTKGLVSPDGKIDNDVVCTTVKTIDDAEPAEKESDKSGNCRFSIQLFSDTNKKAADSAQKKYEISGTHLVEAEVDGKLWYRIRYGCFTNRVDAEKELPAIREKVIDALVVAN
ncbi:MAG TPA: SPOR domain-containing protein, partial [bacterium]|nr:SPOR domain-containing protein [bacterium]